jgi:hypothetical protein
MHFYDLQIISPGVLDGSEVHSTSTRGKLNRQGRTASIQPEVNDPAPQRWYALSDRQSAEEWIQSMHPPQFHMRVVPLAESLSRRHASPYARFVAALTAAVASVFNNIMVKMHLLPATVLSLVVTALAAPKLLEEDDTPLPVLIWYVDILPGILSLVHNGSCQIYSHIACFSNTLHTPVDCRTNAIMTGTA